MTSDLEKAWRRTTDTLDEMRRNVASSTTEAQFQTVGLLGREALISLAQAVFDPTVHRAGTETTASTTDAPRMLEAFFESALGGASNEEARKFAKAAVSLANALQHRRTATAKDAELCEAAVEGVVRVVEILAGANRDEASWQGVDVDGRYFAWAGPNLHGLEDKNAVILPESVLHVIRTVSGMQLTYGNRNRLAHHFDEGKLQVYETDRKRWRREAVSADSNAVLLILIRR